jgi:hypothetical protein
LPSETVEASRMMPARLDLSFSRDPLLMDLPLHISYANDNRRMSWSSGEHACYQHKGQNACPDEHTCGFDHLYQLSSLKLKSFCQ